MDYKYGNGSLDKYYNMVRMYNILESDTNDIGLTVHFDERNLDCFGIRIYHLLFMSCNLFELVAKEMAEETVEDIVKNKVEVKGMGEARARKETPNNMSVWKVVPEICQHSNSEMTFLPMGYEFKPLEALGEAEEKRNLTWWKGYNSVKHDLTQIHNATLRNLIYALSSTGLLINRVVSIRVRALFDGLNLQKPQIDGYLDLCLDQSVLFDGLDIPSIEGCRMVQVMAKRFGDRVTAK